MEEKFLCEAIRKARNDLKEHKDEEEEAKAVLVCLKSKELEAKKHQERTKLA